jgi:serine phosphatase RsbU (regulator of sigma subunit)
MPDYAKVKLNRLLKRREITALLEEYESLLPGYSLCLIGADGNFFAGNDSCTPKNLGPLLADALAGSMPEEEDNLSQPLMVGSKIRGAIILHRLNKSAEPTSSQRIQGALACLHHTLSLLLTKALETRDIVDETVVRYREINLLYQMGETIGTCLNQEKIPPLILQEANRCIQIEAGIVFLASNTHQDSLKSLDEFEVKASTGSANYVKALQQISKQSIDQVFNKGQPVITTMLDPVQPSKGDAGLFASLLCVPLKVQDRNQGVIVLGRLSESSIFTAGEMKLLMALASQASIALETVRLHLEEIQKQRLEEELAISCQIQLSLLPERCPTVSGWEFAATYQAARQVGGDLYDFIHLPKQPNKMGLIIADVSGKGIPAALFMAFCRTLIRMEARIKGTPAQVLNATNHSIIQNSRSELFLSAFYALLDLENGELKFANGGHNPPYWFQDSTGICQELNAKGYLLGLFNRKMPEERQIKVGLGDLLVFYTDGITEARDNQGEFFGEERLESAILANKGCSAQEVLQGIVDATNTFIGDVHQSDDFTLFVIKRVKERL